MSCFEKCNVNSINKCHRDAEREQMDETHFHTHLGRLLKKMSAELEKFRLQKQKKLTTSKTFAYVF